MKIICGNEHFFHKLLKYACHLLLITVIVPAFAFAASLFGSYSLIKDSDGTAPKKGMAVNLTINDNGTCHLEATDSTGANKTLSGDGTISTKSGKVTISLPVLELNIRNKPYSVQGDKLTLPFKVFSEGTGSSSWMKTTSTFNPGTGGPTEKPPTPPTPDDQKGDINKPAPPPPPPPQKVGGGMGDALICTCTDKTYDTPVQVLKNCTRPSLAKPMCGAVLTASKQKCSALKDAGGFKTAYDKAVLGRSPGTPAMGMAMPGRGLDDYKNLVGLVINTFYKPWTRDNFIIDVTPGKAEDAEYAKVIQSAGGKIQLIVRGAAFTEISPAAFIASIGHELIHGEQLQRKYKGVWFAQINDIVAAMNELEASSWETTNSRFAWKIRPNALWSCETAKERDFSSVLRSCREWQVRELLVKVNQDPETQANFASWVDQNPWAKANW
ncbi:MAG TPA: hypothetical protein VMB78_02715, partial [Dissulfurispiraceae bacterium]|nr:hypothetical protein [Dissulfurispiraceae bacterium]